MRHLTRIAALVAMGSLASLPGANAGSLLGEALAFKSAAASALQRAMGDTRPANGADASAPAGVIEGRVVAVLDGDTVTILDGQNQQHRVRLMGIDAPEKTQAFGQRSKQALSQVAFGRAARAECQVMDARQREVNHHRELCKILVAGRDVNLAQVEAGMAWHYKAFERNQKSADRALYAQAEARARDEHRGLWGDSAPTAPWDFRRATKN